MGRRSAALGGSEPRRTGARIGVNLPLIRLYRTAVKKPEARREGRAFGPRQMTRWLCRRGAPAGEEPLDDAVLERMEGDDDKPSARLQQALGGGKSASKLTKFVIEIDSERLEGPRRRVLGLVMLAAKD